MMHQWYKPLFYFDQLEVDYSGGYEIENESEIEKGDGNWIFNITIEKIVGTELGHSWFFSWIKLS